MKKYALLFVGFATPLLMGMGNDVHDAHSHPAPLERSQPSIAATGKIKAIGEDHTHVRIFHDPIPELKWPAMTMRFEVSDHSMIEALRVGDNVRFDFIRQDGKQIITKISQ